jgi:hypothetical protein
METHFAFAQHNYNHSGFHDALGTDSNDPDDWPDDDSYVSYTGPWYRPNEEYVNPEDDRPVREL